MAPAVLLQWNSKSLRPKKQELITLINLHDPIIIAISETWLRPGSRFRIPGFFCLRDDRDDGYAGSAVFIRHNISFSSIPIPSHSNQINAVAVRALNISFLSLYIPHPNPYLIPEIESILSSLPCPSVIMGDFNAHHTLWGCYNCDGFATLLVDIFEDMNLCILNDGSPTRIVYPNQNPKSALDLSLSSTSLASQVSWQVLPSTHGSDHFPIIMTLNNRSPPPLNQNPLLKYRLRKADWSGYAQSVDDLMDSLPDLGHDGNLLIYYNHFVKSLISSADSNIPHKNLSVTNHLPSPPWWDEECKDMFDQRVAAEQEYKTHMSEHNFMKYQRIAAKAKRLVSKKKKFGWTRFCESLNPRTPSSIVWDKHKKILQNPYPYRPKIKQSL